MRNRTLLPLLAALAAVPAAASGATLATTDETNAICEAAAAKLAAGDSDQAFKLLEPYWPLPKEELKNLAYQTTSQLAMVAGRFGAPIGSEHVSTKQAGSSFVQHVYIVKYDRHALRFTCRFYRPAKDWIVNSVTWDDQTGSLFE